MILERFPELAQLPVEEKRQLVNELCADLYGVALGEEDVLGGDPTMQEPLKSEIESLLEARMKHYRDHPESASSWEDVRRRMLSKRHE